MSEWEKGFIAGYREGFIDRMMGLEFDDSRRGHRAAPRAAGPSTPTKKARKASAYSKRYGKAFKRLAPRYKKKNGSWKKDGFKRCAAAARRAAKK